MGDPIYGMGGYSFIWCFRGGVINWDTMVATKLDMLEGNYFLFY